MLAINSLNKTWAVSAIDAVLKKYPDLTPYGFGKYPGSQDSPRRFYRDDELAEFAWCVQWLENAPRTKAPGRRSETSYYLKHIAEALEGAPNHYISNGCLIAALIHLGIPFKRYPGDHRAIPAIDPKWVNEQKRLSGLPR